MEILEEIKNEITPFLDKDEQILYASSPNRNVLALQSLPLALFGLPFAIVPLLFGLASLASFTVEGSEFFGVFGLCFALPFMAIGGFLVLSPLIAYFTAKKTRYILTSKKLMIASGAIGRDYKSVSLDAIRNISVNVGIFDKLLGQGTGSLTFFSGEMYSGRNGAYSSGDIFASIKNPYEVFKYAKDLVDKTKQQGSPS